jgi:hypothetical protein
VVATLAERLIRTARCTAQLLNTRSKDMCLGWPAFIFGEEAAWARECCKS